MAIFGRNSARQRPRQAAQEELTIHAFRAPVDCTSWVTGGLWPAELSTVTAETAPLVKHLKTDLRRIVDATNEELENICNAGLIDSARQAEEARVSDEARSTAIRCVESTVRQLRSLKAKSPVAPRSVSEFGDPRSAECLKVVSSHQFPGQELVEPAHPNEPAEPPDWWAATAPVASSYSEPEALGIDPEAFHDEPGSSEPDSPEPQCLTAVSCSEDTEVLDDLPTLLREIGPPEQPPRASHASFEASSRTASLFEFDSASTPVTDIDEMEYERLGRLLKFVARQEPRLRWGVGACHNGATLLVTDLAHGWIPPGIKLAPNLRLLAPGRRGGAITTLLGDTRLLRTYAPGDPLGWAIDCEVTDISTRPRELPPVERLSWVLDEATRRRDGLPRMVNTLAEASAAGTGNSEAEIDILRVYLDTSCVELAARYPDVDVELLLNCLLLAATEAIATSDLVAANYHVAWFQALSAPPSSGWKASS